MRSFSTNRMATMKSESMHPVTGSFRLEVFAQISGNFIKC